MRVATRNAATWWHHVVNDRVSSRPAGPVLTVCLSRIIRITSIQWWHIVPVDSVEATKTSARGICDDEREHLAPGVGNALSAGGAGDAFLWSGSAVSTSRSFCPGPEPASS